ncbi:hypothetical protein D9M72_358420 [compost metagenome]
MRVAVAPQEGLQCDQLRLGAVADQHRPAAEFDQPHAAQDQRAHDALAQFGLGHQQGAQPLWCD